MLVIMTWNDNDINDGTNYIAGFSPGAEWGLPDSPVRNIRREGAWPVTTGIDRAGRDLKLFISIENCANARALRAQLLRWFDPEDETPKRLVIADDDADTNPRYVLAVCRELRPVNIGAVAAFDLFRVTLSVDGDVRWRSVTADGDAWSITASGQTCTLTNAGEDEAYPVLILEPTAGKTGGYAYRHWVPVVWRSENAGSNYPVMIDFNTATPIAASQMDALGDDLRVRVDGVFVGTTVEDIDDANTKIWFTSNWTQAPQLALRTAFLAGDAVTSLDLDDEVEMALLPDAGTVLIGSEAFVYTGRSLIDRQLTGVTRAAKGTTAANHNADDDVWWIQREVWLMYGNASPEAAPSVIEPAFNTSSSSNTSWVYAEFGSLLESQPAAWTPMDPITYLDGFGCYTASAGFANPWEVLGIYYRYGTGPAAYGQEWEFYNPCGIVNAAYTGGKIKASVVNSLRRWSLRYFKRNASWWTRMENGHWKLEDDPLPAADTWYSQGGEGWLANFGNANAANWDVADKLQTYRFGVSSDEGDHFVEFSGVTVSLYASEVPLVTVGDQNGNYSLEATITNQTTGEAITVSYVMDLDEELEIDTDLRTVTDLADDSGQFQAVTRSTVRRPWLRLLPGDNVICYDDTGTNAVTLTTEWEARYY